MNHLIAEQGLGDRIQCDSAGTSNYHIGAAPDARMTQAAREYGITLRGQGRQVTFSDFETFDYILAMDQANYRTLLALDRSGTYQDKIRLMCSFCQQFSDTEVPDPYYGGSDGFRYVVELLMDACGGLLEHITQTQLSTDFRAADLRGADSSGA